MHARSTGLLDQLWSGLGAIRGVTRYGPPPTRPRTPTLSVNIDGVTAAEAARALADDGLFLSHGDFYASTVAERLGCAENGFLRIGIVGYTNADEVRRLLSGIERLAR